MGDTGYIKLWRKMWDSPYMRNPNYVSVWLWILSNATWKENSVRVTFKGKIITLQKGQLTCGAYQIAAETGVKRGTVERMLNVLKNEEQIEKQSDNRCSLITVKNWKQYQNNEEQNEEQMRNERGTDEEQMRTKEEGKNVRKKEGKNINTLMSSDDDANAEVVDEYEMEFRQFIPIASDVLKHEKTFSKEALTKWKARRKKFSALEITEAFKNLVNECDLWKIENNGFRPLSWWLHSDKRIEDMQVVHLKKPARGKNTGFVIS